jgi:DNA polymerase-3 subunit alpha
MKFTQLQLKTGYTFLKSIIKVDDLIAFANENKLDTLAVTEINVMYSALEFYNACIKNNIKPIIGLEVKTEEHNFLVYAKNYKGYLNLIKLSSSIQNKEEDKIFDNLKDIIVIDLKGSKELEKLNDDYYVKEGMSGKEVPLNDVRFLNKEDAMAHHIVSLIGKSKTFDVKEEIKNDKYFKLANEVTNKKYIDEIINKIDIKINMDIKFDLKFDTPDKISSFRYLESICIEGLKKLFKTPNVPSEYYERLMEELEVLKHMGFEDYFLIV